MEKILFISNIANKVGSFSIASIKAAKEKGMEYHMAANWDHAGEEQIKSDEKEYNVKIHNIPLARNPYSPTNLKAYKKLVQIIEDENIDYIHCNIPVGGLLGRLAGKNARSRGLFIRRMDSIFIRERLSKTGCFIILWRDGWPITRMRLLQSTMRTMKGQRSSS